MGTRRARSTPGWCGSWEATRTPDSWLTPGQVTSLPAGHDAWVVGNDEVIVVDWFGASHYAEGH